MPDHEPAGGCESGGSPHSYQAGPEGQVSFLAAHAEGRKRRDSRGRGAGQGDEGMSNEIRKYRISDEWKATDFHMKVIALSGRSPLTAIEIDSCRCTLTEQQTLDLISVLSRRLLRRKGFQATESCQCITCTPDGSLEVEKEAEPEQLA